LGLAVAHQPEVVRDTRTQFPVFTERAKYEQHAHSYVARLSPTARALVRWLQPYRRVVPYEDALAVLHSIDIADKHKVLVVAAAWSDEATIDVVAPAYTSFNCEQELVLGTVEQQAVVGTVTVTNIRPTLDAPSDWKPGNVRVKGYFPVGVVLGLDAPMGVQPVRPAVRTMRGAVVRVLDLVDRYWARLV
jgi:hypothetical protein